jgi:hypothetical protein
VVDDRVVRAFSAEGGGLAPTRLAPVTQLVVASRGGEHHSYDVTTFEKCFGEHFHLERVGQALITRPVFEFILR